MRHIDELKELVAKWEAEEERKCKNCKRWNNWVYRLTAIKHNIPRWTNYSSGVCHSENGYYGYGVLLDKNSDAKNCKGFIPRGDVNMDFEAEVRKLLAKVDAEAEEKKETIEPCPICGGEMEDVGGNGIDCCCLNLDCPYVGAGTDEAHNIIARVLRGAQEYAHTGRLSNLGDAINDLEALQAKG